MDKFDTIVLSLLTFILLVGAGITMIIIGVYEEANFEQHEVKCYDRYSNEIIGQTCLDKTGGGVSWVVMGCILIAFGLFNLGILLTMSPSRGYI